MAGQAASATAGDRGDAGGGEAGVSAVQFQLTRSGLPHRLVPVRVEVENESQLTCAWVPAALAVSTRPVVCKRRRSPPKPIEILPLPGASPRPPTSLRRCRSRSRVPCSSAPSPARSSPHSPALPPRNCDGRNPPRPHRLATAWGQSAAIPPSSSDSRSRPSRSRGRWRRLPVSPGCGSTFPSPARRRQPRPHAGSPGE